MPNFKRKWMSNAWASDAGYTLEFIDAAPHRFVKYVEGPLAIVAAVKLLDGKNMSYTLFKDRMTLGKPDGPAVAGAEAERVVAGVRALFDSMKWTLAIE